MAVLLEPSVRRICLPPDQQREMARAHPLSGDIVHISYPTSKALLGTTSNIYELIDLQLVLLSSETIVRSDALYAVRLTFHQGVGILLRAGHVQAFVIYIIVLPQHSSRSAGVRGISDICAGRGFTASR
jgi:hypothetical protein